MIEHGLGRVFIEDEQDKNYPARALLRQRDEPERDFRYWWNKGWSGDQGQTSQCVAYTFLHALEDAPHTRSPRRTGQGPIIPPSVLYREAQLNDEWYGENYDGTSARGAAKACTERGLLREYRWGWTVDTIVDWLKYEGTVAFGCWWWTDMFETDSNGFLVPKGVREGGHETLLNGVNSNKGFVRGKNSWGEDWGKKGHFNLTFDDLAKLLEDEGDACMLIEEPEVVK